MKVFTVLANRANYARLFPVLQAIQNDKCIHNSIILTGTTILQEYGDLSAEEYIDQFYILDKIPCEDGGRSLLSMAFTTSNAIRGFSSFLANNKPDLLLIIGDRYETLGVAIAANYLNIRIAHVQGGELSGSADDNIRHCITKLSHLHFAATERSRQIIIQMGEDPENVINSGCPFGDYILNRSQADKKNAFEKVQAKIGFSLKAKYILVSYHPTTTLIDEEKKNMTILLDAVTGLGLDIVWTYPNSDGGSDVIKNQLEIRRSSIKDTLAFEALTNVSPQEYLELMSHSQLCLGNSSGFVRDSSFLGTPVVLVGHRQKNREISSNVLNAAIEYETLVYAIRKQVNAGIYPASQLYGDGNASEKIIDGIKSFNSSHIKTFHKL